ncbi:MAG: class I SAM-dependent methyltransferase [Myxococcota bacterium]
MRAPALAFLIPAALLTATLGCSREPVPAPPATAQASPPPAPAVAVAPASAPSPTEAACTGQGCAGPEGHLPPIDCPLAKAGLDPHHGGMKPFEDTEKYIAFLDREDRAAWQKPDELIRSLALKGTEVVADVGSGSGYFAFRFAQALPKGKVVAIDVDPEMVRHVHHKVMTQGLQGIESVLAPTDDPKVPGDADLVFVCDVLHHVEQRNAWVGKLFAEMKPGARLVIVEFKEGELPQGPPAAMKLARAHVKALVTAAGFGFVREDDRILPYQVVLEFVRL